MILLPTPSSAPRILLRDALGWSNRTGTDTDRKARGCFVKQLQDADLEVRIDEIGNIADRWTAPSAAPEAPPVAVSSHLDSVPSRGIFDGSLGIYGALEAVRAIWESSLEPARPIEVVSWTEEEGVPVWNRSARLFGRRR